MIDIGLIRNEPDRVRKGLADRGGAAVKDLEELISLDEENRSVMKVVEELRAKRNALSQEIGKLMASKDKEGAEKVKKDVALIKDEMSAKEETLSPLSAKTREKALSLPNVPHESVPVGATEDDNPLVRSSAPPPKMTFKPLDHHALGEKLGILDFNAGVKLAGARFALLRGQGARLMRAIITFQLDLHSKKGYTEIWPPYLVKPEALIGTGQLPKFQSDLYRTRSGEEDSEKDLYLIPTAEVPLTNLVRDEIVAEARLPIKMMAYTPCFRQEAGSYGKDVRGLIRNHQFDKVELVWVTKPEESLAALEKLTSDAEDVLKTVGIPYRIIELCTGDIGFGARKTYDLEVWLPSEGKFREISSCSDCGDFQARRMNARYKKGGKGSATFLHTLNGSGVAVGRLFAAILENFQTEKGEVRIPPALIPYFGADIISEA